MFEDWYFFGLYRSPDDDDNSNGDGENSDNNDANSDSDGNKKSDDANGSGKTTKQKVKLTKEQRGVAFAYAKQRDAAKAAEFEDEYGVAAIFDDRGFVDWKESFAQLSKSKKSGKDSDNSDDDNPIDSRLEAERAKRIAAEKRAENTAIDVEIDRAMSDVQFAEVKGARNDARAAFKESYSVKFNKKTGKVYVVDKEDGQTVIDEDTGKPATVETVFEMWIETRPHFLSPKSKLRAEHNEGGNVTGKSGNSNQWLSNILNR